LLASGHGDITHDVNLQLDRRPERRISRKFVEESIIERRFAISDDVACTKRARDTTVRRELMEIDFRQVSLIDSIYPL
jgi:hypothetical protein